MTRFVALLIVGMLSGCATLNTWNEVGRSNVRIVDLNVVPASCGQTDLIKIVGEKTIPIIPFLFETKSKGEVDAIPIVEANGELWLCKLDLNDLSQADQNCLVKSLPNRSLMAYRGLRGERTFKISSSSIPLLVDDLHRHRSFLAIQLLEKDLQGGGLENVVLVLKDPYIPYRKHCYEHREEGVRVVVGRILFVPFAFVADVVFLPVGLMFAPFVHM